MKTFRIAAGMMLCVFFIATASAQVTGYHVSYYTQYDQNSDSLDLAEFEANLSTVHTDDLAGLNLTGPTGRTDPIEYLPGLDWDLSQVNESLYNITYLYPAGDYTFNATGGSVGTQTFAVTANGVVPAREYFTNTLSLNNVDPTLPLTITFEPFVGDAHATQTALTLEIVSSTNANGYTNLVYQLSPSATAFTLPAGVLPAGASYEMMLRAENEYLVTPPPDDADFVDSYNVYESNTEFSFTTSSVPEPASWAEFVLGAGLGVVAGSRGRLLRRKPV